MIIKWKLKLVSPELYGDYLRKQYDNGGVVTSIELVENPLSLHMFEEKIVNFDGEIITLLTNVEESSHVFMCEQYEFVGSSRAFVVSDPIEFKTEELSVEKISKIFSTDISGYQECICIPVAMLPWHPE